MSPDEWSENFPKQPVDTIERLASVIFVHIIMCIVRVALSAKSFKYF